MGNMIAAAALLVSSSESSAVTKYIAVRAAVCPPIARESAANSSAMAKATLVFSIAVETANAKAMHT